MKLRARPRQAVNPSEKLLKIVEGNTVVHRGDVGRLSTPTWLERLIPCHGRSVLQDIEVRVDLADDIPDKTRYQNSYCPL